MNVWPGCVLLSIALYLLYFVKTTQCYDIESHPCCMDPSENLTLAMIIDAFEIYGHDPTDKLDNLWLYENEMMEVKTAEDQYIINEHVHIASDHLQRFITLHIKELKVLLIALDDALDNMLTMFENHHAIAAERRSSFSGGPVPAEFYMSQEFLCGQNVYIFMSETYSDIYDMGKGPSPYCTAHGAFVFLGFVHTGEDAKYFLQEDPTLAFPTDNFVHGLECHLKLCIYRFPFKKNLQKVRDVVTLPKAIVKCGLIMYKLPPLTASSCIITNGVFIFDFNIQGVRYRHNDFLLTIPNGETYYTKEPRTPLVCDHSVCEWNNTNHYGGPFVIPGEPVPDDNPAIVWVEPTPKPEEPDLTIPFVLEGCYFFMPPNYGSIAGKSYLDNIDINTDRFTCSQKTGPRGLYWYPQWMAAAPGLLPHAATDNEKLLIVPPVPGLYYPHEDSANAHFT